MNDVNLFLGDCLARLKELPDNSVDSVVTDPPYGLSFMSKKWDYDVPATEVWAECLRVLKPGGHLLAFAGTRTQHRMAMRIEDAGFEIRDMIAWVYGSGFPKSLDVSKAIDKAAGAEREAIGPNKFAHLNGKENANCYGVASRPDETAPSTDAARHWQGWGTALKPALEPITVARKPLGSTVAECVLAHGTGALNVDGCRVETNDSLNGGAYSPSIDGMSQNEVYGKYFKKPGEYMQPTGRWPANLIHDGSEEVLAGFPYTKTNSSGKGGFFGADRPTSYTLNGEVKPYEGSEGSAARFFYCAKASKRDRDEGLEGFELRKAGALNMRTDAHSEASGMTTANRANTHPTVKPTDLMRYLCRLVTQPGGVVLDPFMGSGSTGKAAVLEGFQFIGIERDPQYMEIARARIAAALPATEPFNDNDPQPDLFVDAA